MPITICFIVFGAHCVNILLVIKVKILVLVKMVISIPSIKLTIDPRIVSIKSNTRVDRGKIKWH